MNRFVQASRISTLGLNIHGSYYDLANPARTSRDSLGERVVPRFVIGYTGGYQKR